MSDRWVPIGVAVLTGVFYAAGALSPPRLGYVSSLGLRWYFVPAYEAFYGAIRDGSPLWWNPYQLCGIPWIGTLQVGFFYPAHALYILLPTPWALAISTVLHLALAAGATAAFVRRAGTSPAAAVLAGAVFALAGPMREWQLWPYMLEATSWLPVGAIGVLQVLGEQRRRGVATITLASGASWLAGGPQGTLFCVYAWAALACVGAFTRPASVGTAMRAILACAGALVGGVVVAAVALLPALELARDGVRPTAALDIDAMYPLGIRPPAVVFRDWFESGSPVLLSGALALAPLACLHPARRVVTWAFALGALGALFALGPATPAFALYKALPALTWFREPYRVLVVSQFALAVLAGLGLDALRQRTARPALPAGIVLALLAAVAVQGIRRPRFPLPYTEGPAWTALQHDAYSRFANVADGARVLPFSPGALFHPLPPKLPSVTRLRSFDDYEPLTLGRQRDYVSYFVHGALRGNTLGPFAGRVTSLAAADRGSSPAGRRRLLDLAAVGFVLMPTPVRKNPEIDSFIRAAGLVAQGPVAPGIEALRNPRALPRAFVTYRARPAPTPDVLLGVLAREDFDPLYESWIEGDVRIGEDLPARMRGAAATIVRDEPHVVEIDATLPMPGLIVLADTYDRSWHATVDGAPAPVFATNHLFRGVPVSAGAHRLRFEYRPRALWVGALLTGASIVSVGVMLYARRSV